MARTTGFRGGASNDAARHFSRFGQHEVHDQQRAFAAQREFQRLLLGAAEHVIDSGFVKGVPRIRRDGAWWQNTAANVDGNLDMH